MQVWKKQFTRVEQVLPVTYYSGNGNRLATFYVFVYIKSNYFEVNCIRKFPQDFIPANASYMHDISHSERSRTRYHRTGT